MRTPLILGNWKMHKTIAETRATLEALVPLVAGVTGVEAGVAPPFTSLWMANLALRQAGSALQLGAQNCHWEETGAFTGEVGPKMLAETGCAFVIVGHSERRQYFGETDERVGLRARAALDAGLTPVVCVGETLDERDAGREEEVVRRQLEAALAGIGVADAAKIVLAYEPVWAIGTGRTATAEQAEAMHRFLRCALERLAGDAAAQTVRILYGGSVKPGNAAELMARENVDGALVGGASLDAETFASIVRFRV